MTDDHTLLSFVDIAVGSNDIQVRVTSESGTTTETYSVAVTRSEPPAFTVESLIVPANHDGAKFEFQMKFSEELELSYVTLRDDAFELENGKVFSAQRMTRRQNRHWLITVTPTSDGAVTVTLPNNRACTQTGAICADDGRRLQEPLVVTVAQ